MTTSALRAVVFFFQAEDGIRYDLVTGVQTCALPIWYQTADRLHDVERRLSARIAAIPGVRKSAAVNWVPLSNKWLVGVFTLDDGRPQPPGYFVLKPCVTPDYFATMGIRIREGRGFLASDIAGAPRVIVISEGVAKRFWPGGGAIGKHIAMTEKPAANDWMTIVGVVDDVVKIGLTEARGDAVYQSLAQVDQPFFIKDLNFVVLESTDPSAVVSAMPAAVRAVDPDQPIEA